VDLTRTLKIKYHGDDAWDYSWAELTGEQQSAALLLGFNKKMCDDKAKAAIYELR